ncbi:proton-coupled amino acid transporter 3 [Sitodiplosis mosellana]|uniref:proton-coupled amino acid transporter 3 n=1 Tax=Sitodiplosis mosellana TaxID=263140 RepID=UPI0024442E61|nr:proton-coupled amino acid transporter 3 [Sitodiplosis mosellana]
MDQIIPAQKVASSSWKDRIKGCIRRVCRAQGLNVFYATLCVIDLFGVFPIVALPGALISCGYYGIPLLIFVLTIQVYTAIVLGRCWIIAEKLDPSITDKKRCPYAAVGELSYGRRMRTFVNILLNVTVFGAGIPNILVASQNLQLIGQRISNDEFQFSFCYWLVLLGIVLCPVMWLGSPKNMKTIASVSVVTVLTTSILIWIGILEDDSISSESFEGIRLDQPDYITMLKVYGMIAFQFDIHPMLMTIEVDMQNKRGIGNAVCYGLAATCTLSVITTILAAHQYGISTAANILEMLPNTNLLYVVTLLVTVQLCLSHAVGSSALFQNIEEFLHIPRDFNIWRCILRSIIIILAVTIAELLPQFDLVMGIIGGTLTGPMIFILPPLFYNKLIRMERDYDEQNERETFNRQLTIATSDDDIFNSDREQELRRNNHHYNTTTTTVDSYGTFAKQPNRFIPRQECLLCFCNDSSICIAVIVFGLIVTITSTYFNVVTISNNFDDFRSPCIQNISASFGEL